MRIVGTIGFCYLRVVKDLYPSIEKIPAWMTTAIVTAAILWLTLAKKPLGDNTPMLFEGMDKIVHAIMFGSLCAAILFDWQKSARWRKLRWSSIISVGVITSLVGVVDELVQQICGRTFEYADIAADCFGAFIVSALWGALQNNWIRKNG